MKVPILFSQHEHRTLTGQKLYFKRVLPLFSKPELGLLPFLPAFGIVVIDPDEPYGRIIVEMYPHHSDSFAPTFELRPDRDPHWYKHFREQFENLWNGCGQRHFSGVEVHKLVEEVLNVSSN